MTRWICENDRYCPDPTRFADPDAFEAYVHATFPGECGGLTLYVGVDCYGTAIVRDEHGEVVLVEVQTEVTVEPCPNPGALGPCMPRVSDGRCVWCERALPRA